MSNDIYRVKSRSDGRALLSTFWVPAYSPDEQGAPCTVDI
jgi:hypothetical protein